jgi:thiol-disulfide isomerase/thioredoxin
MKNALELNPEIQRFRIIFVHITMNKHLKIFSVLIFLSAKAFCAGDSTEIKKYIKMRELVKNGNPAPDFHYISNRNDTVKLSSFSGKIVVLDIWATWCGPCKAEIPYLDSLREKFKNKNVAFISISMDNDKPKWEEFVKSKMLSDIQLWSGSYNAQPVYAYTIFEGRTFGQDGFGSGIPVFVVIGADGKIADNMAPRPSSGLEKIITDQLELKK